MVMLQQIFTRLDQRFGTNEDYVQFCQEAQNKGIKIIMDMILNHSGSEHWFVKDPPTQDWIITTTPMSKHPIVVPHIKTPMLQNLIKKHLSMVGLLKPCQI